MTTKDLAFACMSGFGFGLILGGAIAHEAGRSLPTSLMGAGIGLITAGAYWLSNDTKGRTP